MGSNDKSKKKSLFNRRLGRRPVLYGILGLIALPMAETIYNLNLKDHKIDPRNNVCQRDPSKCKPDLKKIKDSGLKPVENVTVINQKGEAEEVKNLLQKSINDPDARNYVLNKIVAPIESESQNDPDAGGKLFSAIRSHFAQEFKYTAENEVLRKDASILERILGNYGHKTNGSMQTLKELMNNGFRGDCDDYSSGVYTAYKTILNESAKRKDQSVFWQNVHNHFSKHRLFVASLDSHMALLYAEFNNNGKPTRLLGMDQGVSNIYKVIKKDDGLYFDSGAKEMKLMGIYSETASLGESRLF